MTPFLADADFTLYQGDVIDVLRTLPERSVHCCVTSPPYWGLRDYGVDGQIGLEDTPEMFVARMVDVFREVRRVLRDDGTCWINLGDSYVSTPSGSLEGSTLGSSTGQTPHHRRAQVKDGKAVHGDVLRPYSVTGLAPKNMVGIPWRAAFALQADGWYLRSDIIWAKSNPMPESVTDRPTKSHEYVFLLSKSAKYFFDQEAVREPHQYDGRKKTVHDHAVDNSHGNNSHGNNSHGNYSNMATAQERWPNGGRNVRSVWEIATQPYAEAHFATFPQELPRRCIKVGTSEHGCCPECGAPWERETDVEYVKSPAHGSGSVVGRHYETGANNFDGAGMPRLNKKVTTTGWRPTCDHDVDPVPCTVLDPFMGSGSTAHVARSLGRKSVGIELNPEYCALTAKRLAQQSLFGEAA